VTGPTSSSGSEPLLVVEGLTTQFTVGSRRIHAVDGVSFTLGRGATLGVVGESGSGKSVMARSLMGLLPDEGVTRRGSVRFEGRELVGLRRREQRRIWGPGIAIVFQDPLTSLNPVMRIGTQITEAIRAHSNLGRTEAEAKAVELLDAVHVPEPAKRVHQYPNELSGGTRQRVAIAIALSCSPKLLIADEPTTALDVTIQAEILDLLAELQQQRGMSLILISHDLGVVAGRTDEVAVMYGGRIVERGPTVAVFEHTRMPYTQALLGAIPRLEQPSHSRLQAIDGRPPDPSRPSVGCSFGPRCPNAQARCRADKPALAPAETARHEFACWYPLGAPSGPDRPATLARPGSPARSASKAAGS
jgi:peptide/nickel transport system ATP-binding protein